MLTALVALVLIQVPKSNPVVEAAQALGQSGISSGSLLSKSPTAFQPSTGRSYVPTFVKEMFDGDEERKAIEPLLRKVLENFGTESKKWGAGDDASEALAFSISTLYALASGKEVDESGLKSLAGRLKSTFDTAKVREATDAQKQEAYEWAVCSVGYILIISAAATDSSSESKLRKLAETQLAAITGATLDQFSFGSNVLTIRPRTPASAGPPLHTASLAPGFSFSAPSGWTKEGIWHIIREKPDANSGTTSAMVRFLPAVPMQGSFSEILRSLWKQAIPEEFANVASNLVFRRYIGNGTIAHFIFGRAVEKGQRITTLFTLYLVDCATHWQPVVVAQTYEDPTFNITSAVQMSANFSYPRSAEMAEGLLRTIKSPAKPFQTIADKASMVGAYHYGSSANQQWVNVYTGSTSMTFVSYGGDLNLKADGTFDYSFVSASGAVGATNFRSAKGKGTWTVARDELICTFTQYDQGDGHKVKENRYRIAGVVQFADGGKICVLKSGLSDPVNPTTVTDGSEYFTTKKKS